MVKCSNCGVDTSEQHEIHDGRDKSGFLCESCFIIFLADFADRHLYFEGKGCRNWGELEKKRMEELGGGNVWEE